jgi:ribosomal protein S18 acetylase RimI-like enzyme
VPPLPHQAWRDALARARAGELAFLDHPWPGGGGRPRGQILKLLCADEGRLLAWGARHGVPAGALDRRGGLPHFDFLGADRLALVAEGWPVARVRRAAPDDLPAVAAVARRTWSAAHAVPGPTAGDAGRARLDRAYSHGALLARLGRAERLLVAEDPEGRVVAFAEYRRQPDGRMELSALCVAPTAQRRGIGDLLLRRGPAGPLWVQVHPADQPAIRFYERHGFTRAGTVAGTLRLRR